MISTDYSSMVQKTISVILHMEVLYQQRENGRMVSDKCGKMLTIGKWK